MLSVRRTVSRFAISCAVITVQSSLPLVTQAFTGPAKSVFGVYGQPTAGHDFIRVTEKANDRIGVSLKLYYSRMATLVN